MNSGASATWLIRGASRAQFSSLIMPVRIECSGTVAPASISRIMISLRLISRLKIAVGSPAFTAAARARLRASTDGQRTAPGADQLNLVQGGLKDLGHPQRTADRGRGGCG